MSFLLQKEKKYVNEFISKWFQTWAWFFPIMVELPDEQQCSRYVALNVLLNDNAVPTLNDEEPLFKIWRNVKL